MVDGPAGRRADHRTPAAREGGALPEGPGGRRGSGRAVGRCALSGPASRRWQQPRSRAGDQGLRVPAVVRVPELPLVGAQGPARLQEQDLPPRVPGAHPRARHARSLRGHVPARAPQRLPVGPVRARQGSALCPPPARADRGQQRRLLRGRGALQRMRPTASAVRGQGRGLHALLHEGSPVARCRFPGRGVHRVADLDGPHGQQQLLRAGHERSDDPRSQGPSRGALGVVHATAGAGHRREPGRDPNSVRPAAGADRRSQRRGDPLWSCLAGARPTPTCSCVRPSFADS